MASMEVSAKTEVKDDKGVSKTVGPVTVTFDFGDDADDMISRFGKESTFSNARANMVVSLQDLIRQGLRTGKKQAEIQKQTSEWKPGVKRRGRSKTEKMQEEFAKLTPEQRKALLVELTS